ncbi:hypothetical protein IFM89_025222 [Coptis chinensis]|uniref:Transcription factor TFIIIC triple barrel domain-containing protein n=1 Tax=Coptis chinensis TaxID=261450 RepID=A0A835H0U6_9MAGN|nr:hypothetical protein IFM89_025222 [Coptis chinensis]
MEVENSKQTENVVDKGGEEEKDYVLLDLDAVCGAVPPNAPYVLSGLDTLNPVLVIGDNLKLERWTDNSVSPGKRMGKEVI